MPPRLHGCPSCGCQGHGRAYAVTCATCGRVKYPTLPEPPGPGWTCTLCRLGGGKKVAARERAKRVPMPRRGRHPATPEAPRG